MTLPIARIIQRLCVLIICATLLTACAWSQHLGARDPMTPDQFNCAFDYANKLKSSKGRTFVICLDGTWNTPEDQTNVRIIYQIATNLAVERKVIPYYDKGVGNTEIQKFPSGATGYGHQKNVAQAYRFLCMTWKEGDELIIVGFSRGAYQARLLAGMIDYFGIYSSSRDMDLRNDDAVLQKKTRALVDLFRMNAEREKARALAKKKINWSLTPSDSTEGWKTNGAIVSCLCLFDTVATIVKFRKEKKDHIAFGVAEVPKHHQELFSSTRHALHALALDEFRDLFTLVPFVGDPTTNRFKLQQVWFAGAHSDVGGGYNEGPGLSVNSLRWMLTNLTNAVSNPFTLHARMKAPSEKFDGPIHKPHEDLPYSRRRSVRRQDVPESEYHSTVTNRINSLGYKPK